MDKKLTKSNNKMIAGVCAGFAEYFGWEVTIVRILYAFLTIFSAGFPGLLLYIVMSIVMPPAECRCSESPIHFIHNNPIRIILST